VSTWLLPRSSLTPDQSQIVSLPPTEHRIVQGGPGSGKTQVLVHRAAHLAGKYKVPASKYRVFVFTNIIKEYIRSGFQFLNLPDETVGTFDSWCYLLYENHISRAIPRSGSSIDFDAIREGVSWLLSRKPALRGLLDFVLVDEGQDLAPEVYRILTLAAAHVTVFIDPYQKIFEDGAQTQAIMESLGVRRGGQMLLATYRNAPFVAYLASHFLPDVEAQAQFLRQVSATQKIKERPLYYVAGTFDEEMDRVAEIIRQRLVMNERVGIIVGTNRLVHGLAKGLAERRVVVEKAVAKWEGRAVNVQCDFSSNLPKIATFHMAKGLTFDTVILPRLVERSFLEGYRLSTEETRRRLLFVGIARATQWVFLSSVRGQAVGELGVLRDAEREGHLVIQAGGGDWKQDAGGGGRDEGAGPRSGGGGPDSGDDFEPF